MEEIHRSPLQGFGRRARMLSQSMLALLALTLGAVLASGQSAEGPTFPSYAQVPMSANNWLEIQQNPQALSRMLSRAAPVVVKARPGTVSGPWQSLTNPLSNCTSGNAANPLLLTDGTVLVHIDSTSKWCKLTPDINGSYVNGTWSEIASMPSGYAPRFFGSQVLPDGHVAVEGGEYNNLVAVWTNLGASYDPFANTWTSTSPPSEWSEIGDAQSVVLDNGGLYMQADCCDTPGLTAGYVDPSTSSWTLPAKTSSTCTPRKAGRCCPAARC